jgi:cytochrome c
MIPVVALAASNAFAQAVDADAAEALVKKSGCLKCHSVTHKKEAPSYKSIAEKFKGKGDAEQVLMKHLTTNPTVKVDGKDEQHISPKTSNQAEITNIIKWVLSR